MGTMKISRTYQIQENATIVMEWENAPLTLHPLEDPDKREIQLTLELDERLAQKITNQETFLDDIFEVSGKSNGRVTVSIDEDEINDTLGNVMFQRYALDVAVPRNVMTEVANENGSVKVMDLESVLKMETENGSINLSNCSGKAEVTSENGPIHADGYKGNLTIHVENGPVSLSDCKGEALSVESENGPMSISACVYTEMKLFGENGPVQLELNELDSGTYDINTENGIIQITLGKDADFELTAETEMSMIKVDMKENCTVLEDEHDEDLRLIKIRQGEGKARITIHSECGMINVNQPDGAPRYFNFQFNAEGQIPPVPPIPPLPNIDVDFTAFANLANTFANQISQSVQMAMGKIVKKINVPDLERKLELEKVSEKIQKMGEKIQKAVNPDYEEPEAENDEQKSRLKILELLEKGRISPDEAEKLLKAMQLNK